MKSVWGASDIRGGQVVGKLGRLERWLITYRPVAGTDALYALASLSDGVVTNPTTAEELAGQLTRNEDWPVEMLPILAELDGRT